MYRNAYYDWERQRHANIALELEQKWKLKQIRERTNDSMAVYNQIRDEYDGPRVLTLKNALIAMSILTASACLAVSFLYWVVLPIVVGLVDSAWNFIVSFFGR